MSPQKGSGFSLKDHLFNKQKVTYLAELFQSADPSFDASAFVRNGTRPFKRLELKERIVHLAVTLQDHLDADFRAASRQIMRALPPPLDPNKRDDDFGDFIFAPLGEYVARQGMKKSLLPASFRALKALTQRFSMEDAMRQFINAFPERSMAELEKWTGDGNYHVRRLVSEATRPLLPWSGRLQIDAELPLPMLDRLHGDPTRYVTRSVANHLNDISKQNPELVLATLSRWKKAGRQEADELAWMTRHSLRTLVKKGNSEALQMLGFRPDPNVEVESFAIETPTVVAGGAVEFSFEINANRDESLMVDYVIDFVKANGKLAPKVHKLKQVSMRKGDTLVLRKRHRLRADATTYTLYPGTHRITLQINGRAFGTKEFQLA